MSVRKYEWKFMITCWHRTIKILRFLSCGRTQECLMQLEHILALLLTLRQVNNKQVIILHVIQRQPSRGVLRKRFCENMQQVYRRTPILKCDFNKVATTLLESRFGMGILLEICSLFSEHLFLILRNC